MHGRKHLADTRAWKPWFYINTWQGGLIIQGLTWLAVIKSECRSQCLYADTSLEWKSKPEAIPIVAAGCSHQLGMSGPAWQEKLRWMNWDPKGTEHQSGRKSSNHRGCSAALLHVQYSLLSERVDWKLFIAQPFLIIFSGGLWDESLTQFESLSGRVVPLVWIQKWVWECEWGPSQNWNKSSFPLPPFLFSESKTQRYSSVLGDSGKTQSFPFPAPWRALSSPFPSLARRGLPCLPLLLALLALDCFMSFFKPKPNQSQLCPPTYCSFCSVCTKAFSVKGILHGSRWI